MVAILAINQTAFSNSESDVVWRVSRLLPWPSSWLLELDDSATLNLHFTPMLPIKFRLNLMLEKFRDSRRGPSWISEWNVTILAILNFCVTVMPPIKFQLNRSWGLGGDGVWRISRWPTWQPSWISEWNDFSNFESLRHCDASHQVQL